MLRRIIVEVVRFLDRATPQLLLIYTFAFLIAVGTILLLLPAVQAEDIGFIDALFTATSATCVTGLATLDIGTHFNIYGQFIILALIQLGGVGLMSFAAISFSLLGARISLGALDVLDDTLSIRSPAREFTKTFKLMFWVILNIEFIGAIFLFFGLLPSLPLQSALWNACFLSVSAFCNAGFTLFPDSLEQLSWFAQLVIIVLIIFGGLGHIVLAELYSLLLLLVKKRKKSHPRFFSFHVRVVLLMTFILLIIGTVATFVFNYNNPQITLFQSFFESVTLRTAGFSTFSQTQLTTPSVLILTLLMLIGGNAGSCAGGLKTTTLAVWLAHIRTILNGSNEIRILNMKVPLIVVTRVSQIIALAIVWNIVGLIIMSAGEETTPLQTLLFEQISAFATVGLSLDFTSRMSDICQIWIILTMFVGRLGTLTIALAIPRSAPININHPEGRILVG